VHFHGRAVAALVSSAATAIGQGLQLTYHIFWGLEDVIANFLAGWKSVQTNKKVGRPVPE